MNTRGAMAMAGALVALASTSLAFDTKWHADATRVAMAQNGFSADARLAMDQNGFSPDARLLCQFGNYLTDYFSGAESAYDQYVPPDVPKRGSGQLHGVDERDMARLHFDALTSSAQVEHQWKTLEAN